MQCDKKHVELIKKKEMDDILENEIKYKETLLGVYIRLSKMSKANSQKYETTINAFLDDLSRLYKKRKKD